MSKKIKEEIKRRLIKNKKEEEISCNKLAKMKEEKIIIIRKETEYT